MQEVIFTVSLNQGQCEIRTKLLRFVELNCEGVSVRDLFNKMRVISNAVGLEGYGCLFEVD